MYEPTKTIKSSDLVNSINSKGFTLGNKGKKINREVIISNYKEETITQAWSILCDQIHQNYSLGKGTTIKSFGTFTFDNYTVNLEGTTNQNQRDKKERSPVFIVSQEFNENVKPGQYTKNGIIYYTQKLNNAVSHVKVNYSSLSYAISISKDECENVIRLLIKHISDSIREGTFKNKEMPGVGTLILNRNVLGVKFNEQLINESRHKPQLLYTTKKNILLSNDFNKAQGVNSNEIHDTFMTTENLRPDISVLTKINKIANLDLINRYGININKMPVHKNNDIYRTMSQSHSNSFSLGFINDRKNKSINIKTMVLADLNLSQDILESFEFFKGKLASAMKKFDKFGNGTIEPKECEEAIINSNINIKLDTDLIHKIVLIYSKNLAKIDYMKLIAQLIKDSRNIILNNFLNGSSNRAFSYNKKNNMYNSTSNWNKNINLNNNIKSSSHSISLRKCPSNKLFERTNSFNANANLMNNNKKDLEYIFKEIESIKVLLPNIKIKYRIHLNQNISVNELMHILSNYSLAYSKDKIIDTLKYLEINDINAFNILDLEKAIKKCKVLNNVNIPSEKLINIFEKVKDIIFISGGKSFLFPNNVNEISCNEFINILKPKCEYNENTLEALFNYLVKVDRKFTKEDYKKYIEDTKRNFDTDFEINSIKAIIGKIEKMHLKTDEYFDHLLTYNISTKDKVLKRCDFINIFKKEKYKFSAEEIDYIFTYLDYKKDNVIDREEFVNRISHVQKPLSKLQDIIKKNKLDIEDLCHRMDISRYENKKLTYNEFAAKLKKFDYTFSNEFILNTYNDLKNKNEDYVETNKIVEEFNVFKKEYNRYNGNYPYVDSFTNNYMNSLKNAIDFATIKQKLELMDQNFTGKLPKIEYVKVLERVIPNFSDNEHMKFIRINNMLDNKNYVLYPELLDLVYYNEKSDNFTHLCEILSKHIKSKYNSNIDKFMCSLTNTLKVRPISIEEMNNYIRSTIKDTTIYTKTLCKLDVDSDGLISKEDLYSILGRYKCSSFFKYENKDNEAKINLFPSETIKEERFKIIVKKLKQFMKMKNITEIGLFKKLDKNNDGFISLIDFNTTIDSIIKIAPAIKDQFFNFLDYYHNGLVDLETFIYRFKDFTSSSTIAQNDSQIENEIILTFKNFLIKNNTLCDTEIFKLMDKDCDGIINLNDFRDFVINQLSISKNLFNDYKLDRVMQVLSLSKNKNIGLNDIKEFINKVKKDSLGSYHMNLKEIFRETNSQNLAPNKKNTEWISENIERFGMYIAEKYDSIKQFFEENIEKGTKKFKFENFMNFHTKYYECFNNGFNLTKDELLAIFASLDSQKKNYLTLEDLENKLQIFDYYKKMHIDVKNFIKQNFYNGIDAFKFFITYKTNSNKPPTSLTLDDLMKSTISKKEFFDAFENFFTKKYSTNTVLKYMSKYFRNPELISFSEFNFVYFDKINSDNIFTKKREEETKLLTSRNEIYSKTLFKPKDKLLQTPFDFDPLNKLRRIVSSSKYDLDLLFKLGQEQASNNLVNKFQFRNLIKKLDVGITNLEIDQIMKKVGMTYDGKINISEFIKYLKSEDGYIHMGDKNISSIIGEIKQLIYKYYSNPIACFQLNDPYNTFKLDFEKFKQIIMDMYKRDLRLSPNFTLIKNAYDTLDLRKDGIIDINEWTRALGVYNGSLDVGANNIDIGFNFFKMNKSHNNFFNTNRKILREWETSDDVCSIYKTIARNKNMIKQSLKHLIFKDNGSFCVQTDNLVYVLKDIMPNVKLSNTQWKMISYIGKKGVDNVIDLNMFFSMIDMSVKNLKSHPKNFKKY